MQDRSALTDPALGNRVCGAAPLSLGGYGYWLTGGSVGPNALRGKLRGKVAAGVRCAGRGAGYTSRLESESASVEATPHSKTRVGGASPRSVTV